MAEGGGALRLAIFETVLSSLTHCISHAFFKYTKYPVLPVLTFRGIFAIVLISLLVKMDDLYIKSKIKSIILSQFLAAIITIAFFSSLSLIPIGETTIIYQTNVLWSQFIFRIFHREPISKSRIRNSLQCIFGIYLILDFKFNSRDDLSHLIGGLFALFTCLAIGFAYLLLNKIGKKVSSFVIVTHFHLQMVLTCGLGWIQSGEGSLPAGVYPATVIMTLFSIVGHTLQFKATMAVPYNKLSIYTYSQSVGAILMDYLVFGKVAPVKGQIGACIVIISIIMQLREDQREQEALLKSEQQVAGARVREAGLNESKR